MNALQLIEELKKLPPYTEIYLLERVGVVGDRIPYAVKNVVAGFSDPMLIKFSPTPTWEAREPIVALVIY
jgi:hypothetical protein